MTIQKSCSVILYLFKLNRGSQKGSQSNLKDKKITVIHHRMTVISTFLTIGIVGLEPTLT